MTKNKTQITRYLSGHSFKSQMDRDMIMYFCNGKLKCDLTIAENYSDKTGITSQQFLQWYENSFYIGNIVKTPDNVFLIIEGVEHLTASALLTNDHITLSTTSMPDMTLSIPSPEELDQCKCLLMDNGYKIGSSLAIEPINIPKPDTLVKFEKDGVVGYGAFRNVVAHDAILYCYTLQRNSATEIVHDMFHSIGRAYDYDFEVISLGYRRKLERDLNTLDKSWNDYRHRVEHMNMKVDKGRYYYYINDKLKIVREIENGLGTANARLLSGNYFVRYEDANEILKIVVSNINRLLAK